MYQAKKYTPVILSSKNRWNSRYDGSDERQKRKEKKRETEDRERG